MKLVYAKLENGNFGDDLNPYLWPRLFPQAFLSDDAIDCVGIGTILSRMIDRSGRRSVIGARRNARWRRSITPWRHWACPTPWLESRLRSQHKLLGKIVGERFPTLVGCCTP